MAQEFRTIIPKNGNELNYLLVEKYSKRRSVYGKKRVRENYWCSPYCDPAVEVVESGYEAVSGAVQDVGTAIVDTAETVADAATDAVEYVVDGATNIVLEAGQAIERTAVTFVVEVVDGAARLRTTLEDGVTEFVVEVGQEIGEGYRTFVVTAEGLYATIENGVEQLYEVGAAIGNYALSVTGQVLNAFGEAWDSAENAARIMADYMKNKVGELVEEAGELRRRVGEAVLDASGAIVEWVEDSWDTATGWVEEQWRSAMNYLMDLMCQNASSLALITQAAGMLTGSASCWAVASALASAIILLGGGPENLIADSIAGTLSAIFGTVCSAAVIAKGFYNYPEAAGDIQTNSCRWSPGVEPREGGEGAIMEEIIQDGAYEWPSKEDRMNTTNWMRNSLLRKARTWAAYNPIFDWIPQGIKDGMCEYAPAICAASGFTDAALGYGACMEKGAAAAASVALLTGGGFNPAGDIAGITLGNAIGGACVAGVAAAGELGYGHDQCVGDMQVTYCNSTIPEGYPNSPEIFGDQLPTTDTMGNVDKTMFSQYSIFPLSNDEMDAAQIEQSNSPNYGAFVRQGVSIARDAASLGSAAAGYMGNNPQAPPEGVSAGPPSHLAPGRINQIRAANAVFSPVKTAFNQLRGATPQRDAEPQVNAGTGETEMGVEEPGAPERAPGFWDPSAMADRYLQTLQDSIDYANSQTPLDSLWSASNQEDSGVGSMIDTRDGGRQDRAEIGVVREWSKFPRVDGQTRLPDAYLGEKCFSGLSGWDQGHPKVNWVWNNGIENTNQSFPTDDRDTKFTVDQAKTICANDKGCRGFKAQTGRVCYYDSFKGNVPSSQLEGSLADPDAAFYSYYGKHQDKLPFGYALHQTLNENPPGTRVDANGFAQKCKMFPSVNRATAKVQAKQLCGEQASCKGFFQPPADINGTESACFVQYGAGMWKDSQGTDYYSGW